jgi:hypothetical protein
LVHEYHQLPAVWQNDLDNLMEKMDTLMTSILTKIYRGDDGIDAATVTLITTLLMTSAILVIQWGIMPPPGNGLGSTCFATCLCRYDD